MLAKSTEICIKFLKICYSILTYLDENVKKRNDFFFYSLNNFSIDFV